MENTNTTINKRRSKEKILLIEQLKKTPVVQVACEKTGVGRATFYRWRKDDQDFSKITDDAINDGNSLVNDMAESQLMSAIRDKNMTAVIFWLKHHHKAYATKVEITANAKTQEEILNPEQQELIKKALDLADLVPVTDQQEDKLKKSLIMVENMEENGNK